MPDSECVAFLRWALPRMGYRWPGFRRVRGQVCKRLRRRLRELELEDLGAYRELLERDHTEWPRLDACCRITISRFFRDRRVHQSLGDHILPEIARRLPCERQPALRAWSAGCGAGEEPFSLTILHRHCDDARVAALRLEIIATDSDEHQLARARMAVYPEGCVREVPEALRRRAFESIGEGRLRLRERYREGVAFRRQDLRRVMPAGPFELILCRNLAFTYFQEDLQRQVLHRLLSRLVHGGWLIVGSHERLPPGGPAATPWPGGRGIYRRPHPAEPRERPG